MTGASRIKHQVFMDEELDRTLRMRADLNERSISGEIRYLIRLGIQAEQQSKGSG